MTNQLEIDVRELARDLYNSRAAYLFKVPEEMTQTPVDFFGWTPSGRAIAIECKQVKRPTLPIGCSNGLQAHQWNALDLAHNCGAIALLVWRNGDFTSVFSFEEIKVFSAGRKSLPWRVDELCDWRKIVRLLLI